MGLENRIPLDALIASLDDWLIEPGKRDRQSPVGSTGLSASLDPLRVTAKISCSSLHFSPRVADHSKDRPARGP